MIGKNYGAFVDEFIRKNTTQEDYRSIIGEMRENGNEYHRHRRLMRGDVSMTIDDLFDLSERFGLSPEAMFAHIDQKRGAKSTKKMANLKIAG